MAGSNTHRCSAWRSRAEALATRESYSAARRHAACQSTARGIAKPKLSRRVGPAYSRWNRSRRCNSGTNSRTTSSYAPGMLVAANTSHCCRWSRVINLEVALVFTACCWAASAPAASRAVVLLPRWRIRWSPDRIARAGSVASALFLAALAECHALWSIIPTLLLAGLAWVAVVATINVAAQVALPAWIRARGLSIFMIVFHGMMAFGSGFWGRVANNAGIPTLIASRVCLFAFDLCTLRWRIPGDEGLALEPKGQLDSEPDRTVASRRQS